VAALSGAICLEAVFECPELPGLSSKRVRAAVAGALVAEGSVLGPGSGSPLLAGPAVAENWKRPPSPGSDSSKREKPVPALGASPPLLSSGVSNRKFICETQTGIMANTK
jgi:hypothetical protein